MTRFKDTQLHRIRRQISHFQQKSILPRPSRGSIVTFGFDDCPCSAIDTALPMLEAESWRATIYVAVGLCESVNHLGPHMSREDIVEVHARGHEIGDHTFTHRSAKGQTVQSYVADVERNQLALEALGLPPSESFAYPFGDVTSPIKAALRQKFGTLRGVIPPRSADQDANFLPAMPLYSGEPIEAALKQISELAETPLWLNLFTHDVRDHPSAYGCTAQEFKSIVDAVRQSGARVMTARDAYRIIKSESEAS